MHLRCTVNPRDGRSHRRLRLTEYKRNPIHKAHEVKPLLGSEVESYLVRDNKSVLREIVEVDQPNRDMLATGSERHRLITADPRHQLLVRRYETVANDTLDYSTKFVNNFISQRRIFRDLRIQTDKSGNKFGLDQNISRRSKQFLSENIGPANFHHALENQRFNN